MTLNLNEKSKYEVMAKVNYGNLYALSARFYLGYGFSAYLPESELYNCDKVGLMSATVIADKDKLDSVNKKIQTNSWC